MVPHTDFVLQFRLRCSHCNRRSGFRITIFDERSRGDSSKPRLERVVVAGRATDERQNLNDRWLWAHRAQVQEQGQSLPSAASVRVDRMIGNPWLSQSFDEHACLLKRENIALEGAMLAMEGHG